MKALDKHQPEIVILGAGMVGAALALALAPSGVKLRLLERLPGSLHQRLTALDSQPPAEFDTRVSALSCASQTLLEHLGAWSGVEARRLAPYRGMQVWDGMGQGEVSFSADALHESCLGYIVENRVILAALLERLLAFENVRFEPGAELQGISAPEAGSSRRVLTLKDGRQLTSPLTLIAEGGDSPSRQLAGFATTQWDYGHHALVTTVETEKSHAWQCWQRFTETGPLAFLPLAETAGHTASIVWSTSPAHAQELMALETAEFNQALTRAFDGRLGQVSCVAPRQTLALRQRHAQHYILPGLALLGDAAHTIHPLAGQGVNLGFLDVAALAEILIQAHQRGEVLGSTRVLRRYERQRRSDNLTMSASMEAFRRLFVPLPAPLGLLRSAGMNCFNRLPALKNHLVLRAMGLSGDLPSLARRPLVRD